ncbi:MAG: fused MFS/spermidine synthase [Verrucomicrobiota bacterium]
MPAFALTIFTGAFLLFQVQPLIGKYILPWFGGSPGVWTTCMLFFQLLLLGGYAYAHALGRFKPRTQVIVHLVLLAAALATLPITPSDSWKPATGADPTWRILALLTMSLGLPYLVISATGPLMQEWFRRTTPGISPYRLYALSNVGSLLALVSYPFYFETALTRHAQAQFWSWGMALYALCCGDCAWRLWKHVAPEVVRAEARSEEAVVPPPTFAQRTLWLCLPACASILLLAVTNKLCLDVAPTPFLWVVPLGLYLLTFIISFDSPRWYSRFYYTLALAAAMIAVCIALFQGADMGIIRQIVIYSSTLFVGCMICHGELYQLRPHPKHLTSFYLMIAAGGAIGGLFVALVAPAIFNNYYETHLSLALAVLLLVVISMRGKAALVSQRWCLLFLLLAAAGLFGLARWVHWGAALGLAVAGVLAWWLQRQREASSRWHALTCGLMGAAFCALVVVLGMQIRDASRGALLSARNFYGVLSIFEYEKERPESHYYLLLHGRITHGLQFASESRAREITSYFGPRSGLGLTLRNFPRQQNQRVGLLGLGVGTVTAYGKSGDYYRVYEINPQVKDIAEKPFSYIANCDAKVELVMGDGRLSMENEPPQAFDILIMDAFSSDAVPVHLLTKEAFEIYQRHLKPDGAILVNISNRYLDLRPVVENAARAFGYQSHHINNEEGDEQEESGSWWLYGSAWMVLSKNEQFMKNYEMMRASSPPVAAQKNIPLWTDDYASMFPILQD